jgi:hypothetical protein
MANGTFKMKMDIDRHMPNNCKNLNPHYFTLPSTLKELANHFSFNKWKRRKGHALNKTLWFTKNLDFRGLGQ